MKKYTFLTESVGREIGGISKFSSTKNAVQALKNKYPNQQDLALEFKKLSDYYSDKSPKLSNKYNELYTQCSTTQNYDKFLNKICGFSNLWKITLTTASLAGLTYGIYRLISYLNKQSNPQPTTEKQQDTIVPRLQPTEKQQKDFIKSVTNGVYDPKTHNKNNPLNLDYNKSLDLLNSDKHLGPVQKIQYKNPLPNIKKPVDINYDTIMKGDAKSNLGTDQLLPKETKPEKVFNVPDSMKDIFFGGKLPIQKQPIPKDIKLPPIQSKNTFTLPDNMKDIFVK